MSATTVNMDELVALSSAVRLKHLSHTRRTSELDAIPFLTRALSQVHSDSTRVLSARASTTTSTTSSLPAALRLFASTDFDLARLGRAVSALDPHTSFTQSPTPSLQPLRHPTWLSARALDESRLLSNAALRQQTLSEIKKHLTNTVTPNLITLLQNRQQLSRHESYRSASHSRRQSQSHTIPNFINPSPRYVSAVRLMALHGDAPSAFSLLHETASAAADPSHLIESFAIIACIARHAHLPPHQAPHIALCGARVVLEDLFAEQLASGGSGLPSKPRGAAPAAVLPSIRRFVAEKVDTAAVTVRRRRSSTSTTEPSVWAQAFFCMRIGHIHAAVEVLRAATEASGQKPALVNALRLFQAFVEGGEQIHKTYARKARMESNAATAAIAELDNVYCPRIPGTFVREEFYTALEDEYRRVAWPSNDPYMRACYVLLMRLELHSAPDAASDVIAKARGGRTMEMMDSSSGSGRKGWMESQNDKGTEIHGYPDEIRGEKYSLPLPETDIATLFPSVEDYLWFRLWICRTPAEENVATLLPHSRIVTQRNIQGNIVACGSAHFDPDGEHPLLYAFVLTSAGLFEEAVNYLAGHPNLECSQYAVHLGLVLYHLEWMNDEAAFHDKLKVFAKEIGKLYPVEAALYLMNVRDRDVLAQSLKELVIDHGDYVSLIGASPTFGEAVSTGLFGSLLDSATVPLLSGFDEDDLKEIRTAVALYGASEATARGDFATAASLYYTADKLENSIEMITRNLSEEVDKLSSLKRPLAVAHAKEAMKYISSRSVAIPSSTSLTLRRLLQMSTVLEDYWTGRYASAWRELREAEVLPLTATALSSYKMKQASVNNGEALEFHPCVTEVLKAALHIADYTMQRGVFVDSSDSAMITENDPYRAEYPTTSEIKVLCIFAGLLKQTEDVINHRLLAIEMKLQTCGS